MRSVYRIGIWRIGLFNADLAALSSFSLLEIPTWFGSQQNIILKELLYRLWYFNRICNVMGWSSFLLTMKLMLERESEKVDNVCVVVC